MLTTTGARIAKPSGTNWLDKSKPPPVTSRVFFKINKARRNQQIHKRAAHRRVFRRRDKQEKAVQTENDKNQSEQDTSGDDYDRFHLIFYSPRRIAAVLNVFVEFKFDFYILDGYFSKFGFLQKYMLSDFDVPPLPNMGLSQSLLPTRSPPFWVDFWFLRFQK